jgi:hypothetical protein
MIGTLVNIQGQFATNFLSGDNFRYKKRIWGGSYADLAARMLLDLFR